jgi:anti-sigma factor RsiW
MKRSCRFGKYLTAYADGELAGRARLRVEKHLENCPHCASELDSIRASDRILRRQAAPSVSDEAWVRFRRGLNSELDRIDREARRPSRIREARPLYGTARRRTVAVAAACAVLIFAVLTVGPLGLLPWSGGTAVAGNECIVDSIESVAAGYTPMFFSSEDPEMTVIWVFSEDVEGGVRGDGPAGR